MLGAILNNTVEMQQKIGRGTIENLEEEIHGTELPLPVKTQEELEQLEASLADSSVRKKLVLSWTVYYYNF